MLQVITCKYAYGGSCPRFGLRGGIGCGTEPLGIPPVVEGPGNLSLYFLAYQNHNKTKIYIIWNLYLQSHLKCKDMCQVWQDSFQRCGPDCAIRHIMCIYSLFSKQLFLLFEVVNEVISSTPGVKPMTEVVS